MLQNLFKGLYKLDADGTTYVPAMAESCEVSEDGLTYTFTLREGLLWSDGSPLTAHDFEYSWLRVLNPESASGCASDLWVIKNGEAYYNGECTADEVGVHATDDRSSTRARRSASSSSSAKRCSTRSTHLRRS